VIPRKEPISSGEFSPFRLPVRKGQEFHVYDDALFATNRKTFALFDICGDLQAIQIGDISTIGSDFQGIFGDFAVIGEKCFRIRPNYDTIASENASLIAALFRRTEGLSTASGLLIEKLRDMKSVRQLRELVATVGPSARSPAAQVRFARAIQFSGIVNPHMILLGLMHFRDVLEGKMIEEAQIPLFEAMFHPACRHAIRDYFLDGRDKLTRDTLAVVIQRYAGGEDDWKDAAESLESYEAVCRDVGNESRAEIANLIATLNRRGLP
jgi:hypothetical protein